MENMGGLTNFLESILNITVETKMQPTKKQLFEYLPYTKKVLSNNINEIPFKYTNKLCMDYYYTDLKEILKLADYYGRSYLTTKKDMCKAINRFYLM